MAAEEARRKRFKRDDAVSALVIAVGIPERHFSLARLQTSGAWGEGLGRVCALLGKGCLIALIGSRGTGKTQLAIEASRESCRADRSALYTTAMDIFMAIKASYRQDGAGERSALAQFERPSLLIIDEAHVRGETDWENNLLTHLIDGRYRAVKDTVIISNQTHNQFRKSIGTSIYSRLIETGAVIECTWPSFRQQETSDYAKNNPDLVANFKRKADA